MRSLAAFFRTFVLPFGALVPPRIVLDGVAGTITVEGTGGQKIYLGSGPGPNIPAPLEAVVDYTFTAVVVQYFNATDFYFWGIGTYDPIPVAFEAKGVYNTAQGIIWHEIVRNSTVGTPQIKFGDNSNSTPVVWDFRNGTIVLEDNAPMTVYADFAASQPAIRLSSTGIDAGTPGAITVEVWHAATAQNLWTGSIYYRYLASPSRCVQINGEWTPGTKADNTVIFNLPVGYRPISTQYISIGANPNGTGSTEPVLQITTDGNVRCFGLVAGTTRIYVSGIIPIDL